MAIGRASLVAMRSWQICPHWTGDEPAAVCSCGNFLRPLRNGRVRQNLLRTARRISPGNESFGIKET